MSRSLPVFFFLLAFGAGTCLAGGEPLPTRPLTPAPRAPELANDVASPPGTPTAIASVPREVRRAVVEVAAKQFGVGINEVVVTRAEQVTWSDGSLGCPVPGRMYTQMLVPGYRITARSGDVEAAFHTDARGTTVACGRSAAPRSRATPLPPPPPGGSEPRTGPPPSAPDR